MINDQKTFEEAVKKHGIYNAIDLSLKYPQNEAMKIIVDNLMMLGSEDD